MYDDEINLENAILFSDGARGIYVPQHFAQAIIRQALSNIAPDALDILADGPDNERYWDVWSDVLDNATVHDAATGITYTLFQDGDLWLVPVA